MISFFFKRMISAGFTLFGITLLTFLLLHVVSRDPAALIAGKYSSESQLRLIEQQLGTDQPLWIQYGVYLKQVLTLDFGSSWMTQQNINQMIGEKLAPSLWLTLPPFLMTFILSLVLASLRSVFQIHKTDWAITVIGTILLSVNFIVYILFFQYLIGYRLGWTPVLGWSADGGQQWRYLQLPWLIFCIAGLGPMTIFFRSIFIEEAQKNHVDAAKAKGQYRKKIFLLHILRNSLLPINAMFFFQLPFLMMGSLLLESYFSIPGLGSLLIQSFQSADLPVVKALTVYGSLVYLLANLIGDTLQPLFDPRMELP